METHHIILAVVVTFLVTTTIAWLLTRERRTRQALEGAPIVKIRDVRPGATVRVTGKLVLGSSTLEAPFSRRVCAHYDVVVEERFVEDWRDAWETLAHETGSCAFFIEDETGKIEVDTTRFEGIVVRDHHKAKGDLDLERARAFLAKHGQKTDIAPGHPLRYREGVLEAGETVTVLGRVREEPTRDGKRMVLGDGQRLVRASDDPELVV